MHQRYARRTTHEHNFIDVTRGQARIAQRLLTGFHTAFDELLDHLFKFGACQFHQQMLWTARIGSNKRQVDFGLSHSRQLTLRLFPCFLEALHRHRIAAQVNALLALKLTDQPVDNALIEVVATQVRIAIGGFDLNHIVAHF